MARIGYARVSTRDQNPTEQIDALKAAGVADEHLFVDKASGIKADRPELARCLERLQPGDTLVVWRLSRFGRSAAHLWTLLDGLQTDGIGFESLHEHIDLDTVYGRFMVKVMAAVAEMEREVILENVRAGVTAKIADQGHWGPRAKLTPEKLRHLSRLRSEGTSIAEIARVLDVSRQTIYRHLGELEEVAR